MGLILLETALEEDIQHIYGKDDFKEDRLNALL